MPIPDVEKSAAHAATPNSSSRPSKFAVHDAFFDRTGMFWVRSSAVKRLLQWILSEEIFARFLLSAILYGLKVFQCPVDGCEEIPPVSFAGEETPMEPIQALVVIVSPRLAPTYDRCPVLTEAEVMVTVRRASPLSSYCGTAAQGCLSTSSAMAWLSAFRS